MTNTRLATSFVIFTVMLDAIGIGLIMPVMPELIVDLGAGDIANAALWGGILTAVFALMQFLFGPLVGALSDRYGRRPVLLVSLAVMALDYLLLGVAHALWVLFIGRVIGGITAANHSTAGAVIADISKPEQKAANFGLLSAAFGVGFILGPLLGGLLSDFGPRTPFYAAAALAALNCVFGYFVLPETVTDETRRSFSMYRALPWGAFKAVGRLPGQTSLLVVVFLNEIAFVVYPTVWAYFTILKFDWTPRLVGISLACFGLAMAITMGWLIRIVVPRFGEYRVAVAGFVFNSIGFAALVLATQSWMIFALTPISALGALAIPAVTGIMSRAVADDAQGELQGVLASIRAIGMIIGPLVMTQLFWVFTSEGAPIYLPTAPFLLSLVTTLVILGVFLSTPKPAYAK